MVRFKKIINSNTPPTGFTGSKPPVQPANPDMNITANKNAASIDVYGNAEKGDGVVYMTHTITKTTVSKTTDEVLENVGVSVDRTCCEGTDLVSGIVQNTTTVVKDVTTTETTEDIFLPVVFTDSRGRIREVVMSKTSQEESYGTEWIAEDINIEGTTPVQ
jgi:hypothetical protein